MIWRVGTITLAGLIAGMVGIMIGDRDPPTVIGATTVLTPVVAPGGQLKIEYRLFRKRSCAYRLERLLLDSAKVRYPLEDQDFLAAPGPMGEDMYVASVTVPRSFAEGQARYRAITSYYCNLIHRVVGWPITTVAGDINFDIKGPAVPPDQLPIEIIPRR